MISISKKLSFVLVGSALLAVTPHASAQLFTQGDLIVSTYGNLTGDNITDGEITPITLEEFSLPTATSASLVLTDVLPTTGNGNQVGIVGEDGSSSEGNIQLSGNGEYLTIGGYDGNAAAQGIQSASNSANKTSFAAGTQWSTSTIALGQSASVDVPRTVATIDANGDVDTSTALNDIYNTNNLRSVYSPDGTNFIVSGQGAGKSDEGGLYTTTDGTKTANPGTPAPTPIFNSVSTRDVQEYNGNTYYSADQNSTSKGTQTGIFEYSGTPTPQGTNTGTRLTPVSGTVNGKTVNFSPDAFTFVNATTMYVADTGDPKALGLSDGGIQKWSLISGTWTLDYTLTSSNFLASTATATAADGETGFEALTLAVNGNSVDIYAVSYTAGDADPNGLYAIVDTLSAITLPTSDTVTELEAAPGTSNAGGDDFNFKGVSFAPVAVPEPSTFALMIATLLGMMGLMWNQARARKA